PPVTPQSFQFSAMHHHTVRRGFAAVSNPRPNTPTAGNSESTVRPASALPSESAHTFSRPNASPCHQTAPTPYSAATPLPNSSTSPLLSSPTASMASDQQLKSAVPPRHTFRRLCPSAAPGWFCLLLVRINQRNRHPNPSGSTPYP